MSSKLVRLSTHLLLTIAMLVAVFRLPLSTTLAQDPTVILAVPYVNHDGSFSLQYPSGWTLTSDSPSDSVFLTNGPFEESVWVDPENLESISILVAPPKNVAELFPDADELPESAPELLEFVMANSDNQDAFGDIEEVTLSEHVAVVANFNDNEVQGQLFVVDFDDGEWAVVLAFVASGAVYTDYQETVLAIADSMRLHRYEPGDFRLVTSQELNVTLEMPADYFYDDAYVYNDTPQLGAVYLFSSEDDIESNEPSAGELVGTIGGEVFFTEQMGLEAEDFETTEGLLTIFAETVQRNDFEGLVVSELKTVEFSDAAITEAVQFTFTSETRDGLFMTFRLSDQRIMVVAFSMTGGELADFEDTISQIVESIDVLDINAPIPTSDG